MPPRLLLYTAPPIASFMSLLLDHPCRIDSQRSFPSQKAGWVIIVLSTLCSHCPLWWVWGFEKAFFNLHMSNTYSMPSDYPHGINTQRLFPSQKAGWVIIVLSILCSQSPSWLLSSEGAGCYTHIYMVQNQTKMSHFCTMWLYPPCYCVELYRFLSTPLQIWHNLYQLWNIPHVHLVCCNTIFIVMLLYWVPQPWWNIGHKMLYRSKHF